MNDSHDRSACAVEEVSLVKVPVCNGKEDKPKEGVEGRTKEGEEIAYTRNDLGEDKCEAPDKGHDQAPNTPSDDRIALCVSGLAHNSGVDEFGADVGIDYTYHDRIRLGISVLASSLY